MEVTVHSPELAKLITLYGQAPAIIGEEIQRGMSEAVLVAEAEIVDRTPADHGRLRGAVHSGVEGGGVATRGFVRVANVPYALFVEEDTRPHEIRARRAKALRFRGRGGVIFRRRVQHPGTKGQHFFRDGARAAETRIIRVFAAALRRALERMRA